MVLVIRFVMIVYFFFFNDTATTEIYTLSLHDALPIYAHQRGVAVLVAVGVVELLEVVDVAQQDRDVMAGLGRVGQRDLQRSEEHTSELQSRQYLVCRLLLEKKKPYASSQLSAHDLSPQ